VPKYGAPIRRGPDGGARRRLCNGAMSARRPEPARTRILRFLARSLRTMSGAFWWPGMLIAPPVGGEGLHVCVRCGRHFCWPVDWEIMDESSLRMGLRCGECGHERRVVVSAAQAAAFDVELDRHEAAITAAADRLSRERMAVEVETFAAALADDLIDADDFAR
jgi:hypothetical protein